MAFDQISGSHFNALVTLTQMLNGTIAYIPDGIFYILFQHVGCFLGSVLANWSRYQSTNNPKAMGSGPNGEFRPHDVVVFNEWKFEGEKAFDFPGIMQEFIYTTIAMTTIALAAGDPVSDSNLLKEIKEKVSLKTNSVIELMNLKYQKKIFDQNANLRKMLVYLLIAMWVM